MEEVIARFPHLGEQIFQQLDYQNLVRCKMVSRSWLSCVEEQKFYYIRLIKAFTNCSDELLKKILQKPKLEAVIELACNVFNVHTKVPILKECHFGKVKLWDVEHFWTLFVFIFGRDC